jgi:hypothetical protein
MKVYLKILTVLLWAGCCILMGCKKAGPQAQKSDGSQPPVTTQPGNQLIPEQMGTGKSKMTYTYTADYSLCKIGYGDGTSTVLEFTADGKPSLLTHYEGSEPVYLTQYKLGSEGRILSGLSYEIADNIYVKQKSFRILYQSDTQISTINYYNERDLLIESENRLYAENGNLIKKQDSKGTETENYTYDDKNGLFKNVKYVWLFAIEEQNKLFQSAMNNISSCSYPSSATKNQKITYTYNRDNYPENITSQVGTDKITYKVTYKTIK